MTMSPPGTAAETSNEFGGELREEEQKESRRLEEDTPAPLALLQGRDLQKMEEKLPEVIELIKEAQIITNLQHEIETEQQRFVQMKRDVILSEMNEIELEAEKLKKAEEELQKLKEEQQGKSPAKEEVEEVFHDSKDFTKNATENVDKNMDNGTDDESSAAAKEIENLKRELAENQREMIKEDDELLEKEAEKIKNLQARLENEERKYDEIAANLTAELQNETSIHEGERKLFVS